MIYLILLLLSIVFPFQVNEASNVTMAAAAAPVELFTGELMQKLRFYGTWASELPSQDNYVNNNIIHLNDIGADPDVLINNSIYPIAKSTREDSDIALSLHKYDTTNTKITNDELYAISYDKVGSVVEQHKSVLEERMLQHGLHSLAVNQADAAKRNIIIQTSGATNDGKKRLTTADIAAVKLAMDNAKIPLQGRVLVLCNEHINDLLNIDQAFRDRFYNTATGQILSFMGFNIYQDVYCPTYNAAGVKKAFGATFSTGDRNASVFFYAPRAFRAKGTIQMFYRVAELDPENRETVAGFRVYNAIAPKKNEGFGALLTAPSA